jgi:hypothetical protein
MCTIKSKFSAMACRSCKALHALTPSSSSTIHYPSSATLPACSLLASPLISQVHSHLKKVKHPVPSACTALSPDCSLVYTLILFSVTFSLITL